MVSCLCRLRYIRYSDYSEGLNNWCFILKLSYGWIYISCVHNNVCNHMLPIYCNKILIPRRINLNYRAEQLLGDPFALQPFIPCACHSILKQRKGNVDDAPFLFLAADSRRSGFQRAAIAGTCVPTPDSWHALCVPRRAICARRHVPVTWLGGKQEEESKFVPRQRCVRGFFAPKPAAGLVFSSRCPLSCWSSCWSCEPDEFVTVSLGEFKHRTCRGH